MKYGAITLGVVSAFMMIACAATNADKKVEENVQPEPAEVVAEAIEEKGQKLKISTEFGDLVVLLYDDTPIHRDNFIKLVGEGFYNDLLFHRVIKNFMVQGGDPQSKNASTGARLGSGGPGYTLEAEIKPNHIHKKGALAAARQGDQVNPEKRSSGSQFYIVQGNVVNDMMLNSIEVQQSARMKEGEFKFTDAQREQYRTIGGTPHLDGEYTVFGEVLEGMDVIDKIAEVNVDRSSRPAEDVKMTISLIEE